MDQHNEKRLGDPAVGVDQAQAAPDHPTVSVTLGGTDAGPAGGPNPVIGTPRLPGAPPVPPPVIHAAGDARPGEANPAAADLTPAGEPAVGTAQLLADREAAEQAIRANEQVSRPGMAANPPADIPAADATADPLLAQEEQGERNTAGEPAELHRGVLNPVETETTLGLNNAGMSGLAPRMIAKEQQYGEAVQRAESQSGLDAAHSPYERLEYGEAQMNEVRDDVLLGATGGLATPPRSAATVQATFAGRDAAQTAVRGLRDIGIAAADITVDQERSAQSPGTGLGAAGPASAPDAAVQLSVRTDQLTHDVVVRVLRANGAQAVS